jgi:signal-transduction protein with cAMP-binding, CBS, and nucleotidyltransferase domain
MALMTEGQVRHLPVVESSKILGVLSIRDLVTEVVSHHKHVPILNPDPSSY